MATKCVVDLATGAVRFVDMAAAELSALQAAQAADASAEAPNPQRAADLATLRAAAGGTTTTMAALAAAVARLLGAM